MSPLTGGINGAETTVSGTLKKATAEWLVLDHNGREIWVPRSVVLLLQF